MKVSPAFSKAAGSRDRVPGRAPQRAELSCAHKSAGGGLRGNPRRGFPLLFTFVRVRRYVRWGIVAPAAVRPHFFGVCPKKRCRAAKERRFEASTSPRWARPPLPFGRKPQRDELVRQVDLYTVGRPGAQVSLTQSAVMLGLCVSGRGGRDRTAAVAAPKSAFLWGSTPVSLRASKEMGWN